MSDFDQAWIVMLRDTGELDGDQLDVVSVLRVYWAESDARGEVARLRATDPDENHFYYYEGTQVEQRHQ